MPQLTTLPAITGPDDAYSQLRHRIIDFTLLPGEFLSENALASQMGTSRATVREAIARLAEEGCVEVFPQRGTQVSRISINRLHHAVFLRTVLEESVLRQLCSTGITPEQFEALEESLRKQRRYYDDQASSDLLDEDTRMHHLFYEYCGREHAWDSISLINCDMMRIRQLQIMTYSYKVHMVAVASWENTLTEHRMMLDCLRRRDAEAIAVMCHQHLGFITRDADHLRRLYPQYFYENEKSEDLNF